MNVIKDENSTRQKPVIGITMGDAAGIGPEITLKALADENLRTICQPLIIGDLTVLQKTAAGLNLNYELAETSDEISSDSAQIAVFNLNNLKSKVIAGSSSATKTCNCAFCDCGFIN